MNRLGTMIARMMTVVLFCCMALVSCDTYDDSEIWETIKELQENVEALEQQVAENVSALQSIVTLEKIKSCSFDTRTGKVTITLLDGKTITIDQTIEGYPLVTVIKDADGEYYWALCKDGKADFLLIEGAKVPVAVIPDFKVSEFDEWMISVDGGKTWYPTGIFSGSGSSSAKFFNDVKMEGGCLILTLADGSVVKVAVVGEAEMSVSPDSLWFSRTSMLKTASVEMNNVKSYTVTEKPEGWKAYIEESYLNVTSPEDFTVAASQGTVKILALFEGGAQPEILSVHVAYEHPLSLSTDNESVVVRLSERTGEDYSGYIIAAWPAKDFTPELAAEWLNSEGYQTEPKTGAASYAVSELADNYVAKESYIVFAVPYLPASQVAQGNMSYRTSDLKTIEFTNEGMYWSFSDISYDHAHLKASFTELTSYYGGFFELGAWNNYGQKNIIESISYGALQICTDLSYEGPASGFPFNEEAEDLLPSTEYVVWLLPYKKGNKYKASDFITKTFTTKGISADASMPAPEAKVEEITISGFTATVTPAAGAYKTYAAIRPVDAVPEDELESVTDMMKLGNYSKGNEVLTVSTASYDSSTELCLLAVSVTEDGRFGAVSAQKVQLKELEFRDDLSVSVTGISHGLGDVTLSLAFEGNPESLTYFAETFTFYTDETLQKLMALGQLGNAKTVKVSSLENGCLNISGLTVGSLYTFYAVVSDADGAASKLYKYDFTPSVSVDYVIASSADYGYGMPSLSGKWKNSTTYMLDVDMPAECLEYWIYVGDPEYMTGDPWTDSDKILTDALYGISKYSESMSGLKYEYLNKASRVYMVWLDDKGAYHAIYEYNPQNDR